MLWIRRLLRCRPWDGFFKVGTDVFGGGNSVAVNSIGLPAPTSAGFSGSDSVGSFGSGGLLGRTLGAEMLLRESPSTTGLDNLLLVGLSSCGIEIGAVRGIGGKDVLR